VPLKSQSACATLVPLVIPTAVKRASAFISSRVGRRDLAFLFILRVGWIARPLWLKALQFPLRSYPRPDSSAGVERRQARQKTSPGRSRGRTTRAEGLALGKRSIRPTPHCRRRERSRNRAPDAPDFWRVGMVQAKRH